MTGIPMPIDPMKMESPLSALRIPEEELQAPLAGEAEEMEDGSLFIPDVEEVTEGPQDKGFYSNLADGYLSEVYMDTFSAELIEKVRADIESRKPRTELYAEGMRRTGLGRDAPGGAQFQGASRVVHPALLKASVDFSACTIKELYPPNGPVKMKVEGKATTALMEKARRKAEYMNWQLREQIPEYKPEMEQICTQVPIGGVQYMLWWYDDGKKRPRVEFFPVDKVILPFNATSFYTASRATLLLDLNQNEYNERIRVGLYRDIDLLKEPPAQDPEQTEAQTANDKIEGKTQVSFNQDGDRQFYQIYIDVACEHDQYAEEGRAVPYLITLDPETGKVLAWYRNWEPKDPVFDKMDWVVEFPMIPWRGAQAIGLVHALGGISAAQTGAVRALLDTAHINNSATLLKLKGAKIGGQNQTVDVTGVTEVDGGIGVTDIRQIAMPMPFNQPSTVLFQLLGYLDGWSEGVVRTTLDNITVDQNTNVPVGTQMSRVEQGLKVYSSIFGRLHDAQARCFKILHRLNRTFMPEAVHLNEEDVIYKADFEGPMDVTPVSDPNIFSEMQRYAQMQEVDRIDALNPGIIDKRKKVIRQLEQLKVPDYEGIMVEMPEPEECNPVIENMKMSMGAPVAAYPQQDHLAHMQVLLSFMQNPMLGANPLIAPVFMPAALEHLKQHMMYWYVEKHAQIVERVLGPEAAEVMADKDPKVRAAYDRLMAATSTKIDMIVAQEMEKVPPVIKMAQEMVASMQPQITDPNAQASALETRRKGEKDKMDNKVAQDRLQLDREKAEADVTAGQRDAQAEAERAMRPTPDTIIKADTELQRQGMADETKRIINTEDNDTARELAILEVATGDKVAVSTGNGIGKNPRPS